MDLNTLQHLEEIGDTKLVVSPFKKLQQSVHSMEEEKEILHKQTSSNRHVAYLKKRVTFSQKMLALQKNSNSYTVGEYVLLDESQGFEEDLSDSMSLSSMEECLCQRSLWRTKNVTSCSKDACDLTTSVSLDGGNFSFCPPEVNFQIFSYLPQSQIVQCRSVCQRWRTQIDFFFAFHCVLTARKLRRRHCSLSLVSQKNISFEISHYDITEFSRHLKHKHFEKIPEPKSIRIIGKISSKNFLKLIDCWRTIEYLSFHLEPLTSQGLFQKWSCYNPPEYFPQLRSLDFHLDRLHLTRYKSFNAKQLRFNLDQILMNPYNHLHTFSYQMLNVGRHFACAFLAPILMFIGRQGRTLRKIQVVFHNGYEFETIPSYGSAAEQHHAPSYYAPLDDQIYVHGYSNLLLLPLVKLTHCSLAIPAISGCTTHSSICNHFTKLLQVQKFLRVLRLEIQMGVDFGVIESVIKHNQNFLTDIELTINLFLGDVFNLTIFSKCSHLKSLRLKRVGFIDLPNQISQLSDIEQLPKSLQKLSLHRFYISVMDLYMVVENKPSLQCLCICCCYVQATIDNEIFVDGAMAKVLIHPELKFVCFSPIRRNTLSKIVFKLKQSDHFNLLLNCNTWHWTILSKELWLGKPRQLILHRGQQYCTRSWFKPYIFEKVKV